MSDQEYQDLLNNSGAFKLLDDEFQQEIRLYTGEKREKYIEIFQEERMELKKAFQEFKRNTENIVL